MRILILADIHANWSALQAIDEPFDVCLFLGDLVDYGPEPEPCVRWVQQHATHAIRGNHDHAVAQNIVSRGDVGYPYLTTVTRPLMWQLLNDELKTYLGRLPVSRTLSLGDHTFHLVHATPRDPLDEWLLDDPEQWERRLHGIDADFVCVGHTHHQFVLQANETRVLNPGSVGQPRDGDPRAAYAIIDNGEVELKRVEYDIDRTLELIRSAPIPQQARELTAHVLRTGGRRG